MATIQTRLWTIEDNRSTIEMGFFISADRVELGQMG
jgi:hypothetical protein